MNFQAFTTQSRISLTAAIVVILSGFLPWFSFMGMSVIGIEGWGIFPVIFAAWAIVTLGLSTDVTNTRLLPSPVGEIILVVLAALITVIPFVFFDRTADLGLYLTLLAAIVLAATNVVQVVRYLTNPTAFRIAEQHQLQRRQSRYQPNAYSHMPPQNHAGYSATYQTPSGYQMQPGQHGYPQQPAQPGYPQQGYPWQQQGYPQNPQQPDEQPVQQ